MGNKFITSINTETTTTENGAITYKSSLDKCVDLFFKIGATRNVKEVERYFTAAMVEDPEVATRIMLYTRDIRKGLGIRNNFRVMLKIFKNIAPKFPEALYAKIVELGYWKDLVHIYNDNDTSSTHKYTILRLFDKAIKEGDGLCAKWTPRKGMLFNNLAKFNRLSPKQFRRKIVDLTKVVEQQMCANDWDNIEYSHVPSIAHNRYKSAFARHSYERYSKYLEDLKSGKSNVKINSSVLYPHEIVKNIFRNIKANTIDINVAVEQWKSLPNLMPENGNIMPMIDVSASMNVEVAANTTAKEVAIGLGLYVADKNKGAYKDTFMTFSTNPKLIQLKGNLYQKVLQIDESNWNMSTNLLSAFDRILAHAVANEVPKEDMPSTLIILSDMEFDRCVCSTNKTTMEHIRTKYETAGYDLPNVVFWNIASRGDNVPVRYNELGVALVSGFSPNILNAIFNVEEFNPKSIMLNAVMDERYSI